MVLKAVAFVRAQLVAAGYESGDLMQITPVISCALAQGLPCSKKAPCCYD